MDSLTAHYVARELREMWVGHRVLACALDRARRAVVISIEQRGAVRIDLDAPDPMVRMESPAIRAGQLAGWTVTDVRAPADDRRLVVRFERPGKFRGSETRRATLEASLIPTARAALLRVGEGHGTYAVGGKLPPAAEPRPILEPEEVRRAAITSDVDALLRGRWVSPPLARWLIQHPLESATMYAEICALPAARPARCGDRLLPFPWCDSPEPMSSLIEGGQADRQATALPPGNRRHRALQRMREELERAAVAPVLRRAADALMAMGAEGTPPRSIELEDGTRVAVDVQEGDTPVTAAERLYRQVRSMERALESLPERLATLAQAPEASDATAPRESTPHRAGTARSYRTYRSSGGLDIWVGRGAASNDRLTFRDAAPDDVWLHARDEAGAHVVLRWTRDEPPPARDLEEAAMLAAWHSKARGAAVVPVDWTRRKHVRKPRGGAPGLVIVQRAHTIFVRPDAALERKLHHDPP